MVERRGRCNPTKDIRRENENMFVAREPKYEVLRCDSARSRLRGLRSLLVRKAIADVKLTCTTRALILERDNEP